VETLVTGSYREDQFHNLTSAGQKNQTQLPPLRALDGKLQNFVP
jgi:hypothetical protein